MLARISQARRRVTVVHRVVVNHLVNFLRFDARTNVRANEVDQLSIELTRFAHLLSICLVQSDFWSSTDHGTS